MRVETGVYAAKVPRSPVGLAEWRLKVYQKAAHDIPMQKDLKEMCRRDILFWYLGFIFTYDPRLLSCSVVPFALYPFQERMIREMSEAIGFEDMLIDKCRDIGASWIAMGGLLHRWQFRQRNTFLVASAKEDLVDNSKDPDCLFWKVDFMLKHQPPWLRPAYERRMLNFYNVETESTIDGCSTTGDIGRGGRRTAILLDEFAKVEQGFNVLKASQRTTNSRIFNSTHKGVATAFYMMSKLPDIRKLEVDWWEHPEWRHGLYKSTPCGRDSATNLVQYRLEIVDTDHTFPKDYNFILDGKIRSPWYDHECRRASHPSEIAQEIDRNPQGSDSQFFDSLSIQQQKEKWARPPVCWAELEYDSDSMEPVFLSVASFGRLALWLLPGEGGKFLDDRQYVLSADISSGTGASNSALMIGDKQTEEKIGEFVDPNIPPHQFAKFAVALAKWLGGAYLIWEANGPGRIFGNVVLESGYRNIYYRTQDDRVSKLQSDIPGFFSTAPSKLVLLGDYRRALIDDKLHQVSIESLNEASEYVFAPNGDVRHAKSQNYQDPSGARDNHGDRVIADSLLWKALKGPEVQKKVARELPFNCFEARRQRWLARQREKVYW